MRGSEEVTQKLHDEAMLYLTLESPELGTYDIARIIVDKLGKQGSKDLISHIKIVLDEVHDNEKN